MLYPTGRLCAFACIDGGDETPDLSGVVKFYQSRYGVLVSAEVYGLPRKDGFFGFHIHEGESCGGEAFAETKNHYNPEARPHPDHAGDLPPLLSAGGRASMTVLTGRFRIPEILGRTVVIHGGSDDFHTQPGGDAGTKIACGVIKSCCR